MKLTPRPPEDIFDYISYNPEDGTFAWKKRIGGSTRVGKAAGHPNFEGYIRVTFRHVHYSGHSLAWLHQTGDWLVGGIDHKNLVRSDNRFANLRSKTALMKQALRMYHLIIFRLKAGETVYFSGDRERAIEFVGPGFPIRALQAKEDGQP